MGAACGSYPACRSIKATGCANKVDTVGKGLMCAADAPGVDSWTSPELKWVTAALRLYLHFDGDVAGTTCGKMLWGSDATSFRKDPNMARTEMHGPRAMVV